MKMEHFEEKDDIKGVKIKEEDVEVTIKAEKYDFGGANLVELKSEIVAWNDFEESSDPQENHEFDGVNEEVVDINEEEIVVWNDFEESDDSLSNKKNAVCRLCNERVVNFQKHVFSIHKDHQDVANISMLLPNDPVRKKVLQALRYRSFFLEEVICTKCNCLYSRKSLSQHYRGCAGRVGLENRKARHYCLVPTCKTTSRNSNKLFFTVPLDEKRRRLWLKAIRKDYNDLSPKSNLYICEDHFNLEEDMENYIQWKYTPEMKRKVLKSDVVPHIFNCQPDKCVKLRPNSTNRKRKRDVEEANVSQNDQKANADGTE